MDLEFTVELIHGKYRIQIYFYIVNLALILSRLKKENRSTPLCGHQNSGTDVTGWAAGPPRDFWQRNA